MAIKRDTLDGLLAGHDPQAVFAKDGLFDELKKALAQASVMKGEGISEVLVIFGQASVSAEPRKGPFDNPATRQDDESWTVVGTFGDLHTQRRLRGDGVFDLAGVVAAVGPDEFEPIEALADAVDIDGLVANEPLVADFDPQRVEEDQGIHGFQRPVLPFGDSFQNRVRHRRYEIGRDLEAVKLQQMPLDLANGHAARIHRHDLLVEARKPA
jgi:hypothetical protein